MSDPVAAFVAALLADEDSAEQAGTDMFGGELPGEAVARMPGRMIVIAPSGGVSLTGDSDAEIDTQRLDLLAYAGTPAEANRLCATATRRLLMIRREAFAGTFIHWVKRAGGFSQARDRDGQWPMAFRSFQLLYSLKEVQ